CYGNDGAGDPFWDGIWSTVPPGISTGNWNLSELVDLVTALAMDTDWDGSDPADWELTTVQVELYTENTFYVDDITIAGVTYPIELFILESDYFNIGSTVTVNILGTGLNVNPARTEKYEGALSVRSTITGDQFYFDLEETGVDTGIFAGIFTIVSGNPAIDELAVEDGDIIEMTYFDLIRWVEVDDSIPLITILTPEDGAIINDIFPIISANVTDNHFKNASITLNDILIHSSTIEGILSFEIPSFFPLNESLHMAKVIATDEAGNVNIISWSFTVDITKPTYEISMNVTEPV
ncbi:unnamed protein product, partial [marine sediment metagenome]